MKDEFKRYVQKVIAETNWNETKERAISKEDQDLMDAMESQKTLP